MKMRGTFVATVAMAAALAACSSSGGAADSALGLASDEGSAPAASATASGPAAPEASPAPTASAVAPSPTASAAAAPEDAVLLPAAQASSDPGGREVKFGVGAYEYFVFRFHTTDAATVTSALGSVRDAARLNTGRPPRTVLEIRAVGGTGACDVGDVLGEFAQQPVEPVDKGPYLIEYRGSAAVDAESDYWIGIRQTGPAHALSMRLLAASQWTQPGPWTYTGSACMKTSDGWKSADDLLPEIMIAGQAGTPQ